MAFNQVGETEIRVFVERFYAAARADAVLGPVFEAHVADWDRHFDLLTRFWSSVILTSGAYKGNPLAVHKALAEIEPSFFGPWLAIFEATARDTFTPDIAEVFIAKAHRIAESLKIGMFYRPEAHQG